MDNTSCISAIIKIKNGEEFKLGVKKANDDWEYIMGESNVKQYIKDYGAKIRILDEAILTTGIGVAFPENTDSELPEKLTEIFKEMRKDGSEEKF